MKTYETLTQEIFNPPDCPVWAEWAAVNEDGSCWVFSHKPERCEREWFHIYGLIAYMGCGYSNVNWEISLIKKERKQDVFSYKFKN